MNFLKRNEQIENTTVILMTIKTDGYWGFENQD
jgi:hypothetical protein